MTRSVLASLRQPWIDHSKKMGFRLRLFRARFHLRLPTKGPCLASPRSETSRGDGTPGGNGPSEELVAHCGRRGEAGVLLSRIDPCAPRSDGHEEASVKNGASRLRDIPDIHSASSAVAEHHERVSGRSHSTPRRRIAPRRTSGCDLSPATDLDLDSLLRISRPTSKMVAS
jgi:hypothetical protein